MSADWREIELVKAERLWAKYAHMFLTACSCNGEQLRAAFIDGYMSQFDLAADPERSNR